MAMKDYEKAWLMLLETLSGQAIEYKRALPPGPYRDGTVAGIRQAKDLARRIEKQLRQETK